MFNFLCNLFFNGGEVLLSKEDIEHKETYGTKYFTKTPIRAVLDKAALGIDIEDYLDIFTPESIYYKRIQEYKENKKRMDINYFY